MPLFPGMPPHMRARLFVCMCVRVCTDLWCMLTQNLRRGKAVGGTWGRKVGSKVDKHCFHVKQQPLWAKYQELKSHGTLFDHTEIDCHCLSN